jgi:hypothetical protein
LSRSPTGQLDLAPEGWEAPRRRDRTLLLEWSIVIVVVVLLMVNVEGTDERGVR